MKLINRKVVVIAQDVLDGLRTQPARFSLAFLSVAIGIGALTALIVMLDGLREKMQQVTGELGANVVGILRDRGTEQAGISDLQEKHALLLASNLRDFTVSTIRSYKSPTLGTREPVLVVETDNSLLDIRQWQMRDGRFLDHWDVENRERYAVVSESLYTNWAWGVGSLILLGNVPFRIIGIVRVGGGGLETEFSDPRLILGERVVFIPKTATPRPVTNLGSPYSAIDDSTIDAIFMRVPISTNFAQAVSTAQRLLSQPDYIATHISWVTPESLIQALKRLQQTISLTVGSIAALCLVLGGTTLMSLMVANVRDRVTEIGLRRAIGASQRDIAILFALEACIVTSCAAVAGTFITYLVLFILKDMLPVPFMLSLASFFAPLMVAVILGLLFSYWPARSAARMTASEALRNE